MFRWYRELSGLERRTFWGCFGGWALDATDAQIFSFIIPALIVSLKVSRSQIGDLGTISLIAAALGGWISGVLADRYGRVWVIKFTIIWFAFFTFLAGFVQSYDQMLIVRVLQGLGFGGEWGAGAVLVGEIIQPRDRGKAVGCLQSGYSFGWAAATILSTLAFLWLPADYAWRALLWLGVLPAFLVIFIRRFIQEPAVFQQAKAVERVSGIHPGFFAIFHPSILRTTVLASLLALGVIGAGSVTIYWLPTFMKTVRHLSVAGVGTFIITIVVGSFLGFIGSAYLTDIVGRRRNFLIFSIMSCVVMFSYMYLALGYWELLLLGMPFGFFTSGSYSSLGPYFTELFPTAIRGTGQSFSYNFGKGVGGLSVAGVGWLAQKIPLGDSIGAVALGGYLLAIVATLLLPETRGLHLSATDDVILPASSASLVASSRGRSGVI